MFKIDDQMRCVIVNVSGSIVNYFRFKDCIVQTVHLESYTSINGNMLAIETLINKQLYV